MTHRRPGLVLAAAVLIASTAGTYADEFATARLTAGMDAYRARRFAEASDQFRIACFGLLDQPILLTEGLVRLALAQENAGRTTAALATLSRFVEVERRFEGYAKARLEAPTRAEFEALLRARIPKEELATLPSLSAEGSSPQPRRTP